MFFASNFLMPTMSQCVETDLKEEEAPASCTGVVGFNVHANITSCSCSLVKVRLDPEFFQFYITLLEI